MFKLSLINLKAVVDFVEVVENKENLDQLVFKDPLVNQDHKEAQDHLDQKVKKVKKEIKE